MINKEIKFTIRLTPEQIKILEAKANQAGFNNKSEYIRSILFLSHGFFEKIDAIYNKVVEHEHQSY